MRAVRGHEPPRAWDTLRPVLGAQAAQEQVLAQYDGAIAAYDQAMAGLFDAIDRRGVGDRTVVVLVSNHGEELGEHNLFSHGVHYDTVLHIPLFVYDPRRGDNSGQRVTTMVQGIDVAPTVLALAGVTHDETMDGQSLVPLMDGEPELYATGPAFSLSDSLTASMHTPESKLYAHPFRAPPPPKPTKRPNLSGPARLVGELYRLDEDPGETNDLALTEPDWVQTAWQQLEPWLEARTRDDGSQQTPHVAHDQRMADRLRADGY